MLEEIPGGGSVAGLSELERGLDVLGFVRMLDLRLDSVLVLRKLALSKRKFWGKYISGFLNPSLLPGDSTELPQHLLNYLKIY